MQGDSKEVSFMIALKCFLGEILFLVFRRYWENQEDGGNKIAVHIDFF